MAIAIVIGFLFATAIVVWAIIVALSGSALKWKKIAYLVCSLTSAAAAYFTTYHYVYYANANTRLHGWPVPVIVFQRDSPTAPWLDFVGPTVALAYPMNFILFALLPSLVFVLAQRLGGRSQ